MSKKVLNSIYNTVPIRLKLNYYEIYALTQNQHHQVKEHSKYSIAEIIVSSSSFAIRHIQFIAMSPS